MAENNHINVKSNSFKIPTKCVKNVQDITVWEKSEAYQVTIHFYHFYSIFYMGLIFFQLILCYFCQEYLGFIFAIGDAIKGKKIRDVRISDISNDSVVKGLIKILDVLDSWINEIPPVEQQQRFGNKAFRDWHIRLETVTNSK